MGTPLLLSLLLAVPAGAGTVGDALDAMATGIASVQVEPVSKDLSDQFPDAAKRNQKLTGSCHVFTTISLIEAAIYRAYGEHLALSEADLFVRKSVKDEDYYSKARAVIAGSDGMSKAYELVEGGVPAEDIDFVLKHGVATAETLPWNDFVKRYYKYRNARLKEIETERKSVAHTAQMKVDVREDFASLGNLEERGLADRTAQVRRVNLQRAEIKVEERHQDNLAEFKDFMGQIQDQTEADAETLLLGENPQIQKDRARVQTLTSGMRLKRLNFPRVTISPEAKCSSTQKAEQKQILVATLEKGVPVSVGMDLAGLPEWGQEAARHARHAFTIVGYEKDAEGNITLQSRNSWGGKNPDIPEKRLCRIYRMSAVLVGKE